MSDVNERCYHGLEKRFCGLCKQKEDKQLKRTPAPRKEKTVLGADVIDGSVIQKTGYVMVRASQGRQSPSFAVLGKDTRFVHIDGLPFVWLIKLILERAPNVKTIQVVPTMVRRMRENNHLRLCREQDVDVISGYHRPDLAWGGRRDGRSKEWVSQRKFLLNLEGEQKALFDELLTLGEESALMASRYFCLKDEEYVPLYVVGSVFGYNPANDSVTSCYISAVLFYLDASFPATDRAKSRANGVRDRVLRLRSILRQSHVLAQALRELDIPSLPPGLPLARFETFKELMSALQDGRLHELEQKDPRAYQTVVFRFGLEKPGLTPYRLLDYVAEGVLGGVSRERARQLEARALKFLSIEKE